MNFHNECIRNVVVDKMVQMVNGTWCSPTSDPYSALIIGARVDTNRNNIYFNLIYISRQNQNIIFWWSYSGCWHSASRIWRTDDWISANAF